MNRKLLQEFCQPGSEYRGAPFWAWNGKLEQKELRRQVRVMHRMGLGGFFMHSRVGLSTPYLSNEWFECVNTCIDEAEKLGMNAWLYDEDRWPSGAAGGLVTKDPKYRQRQLVLDQYKGPRRFKWTKDILAAFTAKVKGPNAREVRQLVKGKRPSRLLKGETILAFKVRKEDCSDWYNGYTYLDTMSHEAVAKFIKVTHEAYRKHCGKYFGRWVPGIFTDEPNHGSKFGNWGADTMVVPWTDRLPVIFKKRYGYDLLPHLPEIFFDVEGQAITPARYHYHDCVTHLFVDAFARQIGEWCDKNKLQHSGHVLCEETLCSQTNMVGSCMRFYEHMQVPGMDILTEHSREYNTAKQVSSAARQFGRKWRLTETYGCTGWDFPFVGHKAIGDWQAALGINLRCQHLSWYTMEGEAKRDFPAGIFYQSPWWELYPKVEDYFARVNAVMTQGNEVRDLLVIHPVESMWTLCRKGWTKNPEVHAYDTMFMAMRDSLLAENIDFDYGDEDIIARHGRIIAVNNGIPTLMVAKAPYKAVVVPPLLTIRGTTLKLLKKFKAAGGVVVFAGTVAEYLDAKPSKAVREFAATCIKTPAKGSGLAVAVEKAARRISITDTHGRQIIPALHLLREDKNAFYLFVCNTGHKPGQLRGLHDKTFARDRKVGFPDVRIRGFIGCKGQPLELDPDTGQIFSAEATHNKGGLEIRTTLPPIGSRLFVIPKNKGEKKYTARKALKTIRSAKIDCAKLAVTLSENNNLVLDRPQYRIGNGPWKGPREILAIDREIRETLGVDKRGGAMVQPWARKRSGASKRVAVTLKYNFEIKEIPSGNLFLALEQPKAFQVIINGMSISTDAECGWWCDRSLRKLSIDQSLLHKGKNEIVLACDYTDEHPGLEIIYLLGAFGVKVNGTDVAITSAPAALKLGDWCRQGLAFYSGSVSYCKTISPKLKKNEHIFVQIPEYRGVAVRVLTNGKEAGIIAWEPNEVDITELVGEDPAQLRIEVIGHRRNSHGPHHWAEKWPNWTGPGQYHVETDDKNWYEGYQLVPCGLMRSPKLVWKR